MEVKALMPRLINLSNRVRRVEAGGGGGGVTDHGFLSGLADDDHPQYLNIARGDARYYTQAQVTSAISTAVANLINSAPGALDTLDELAAALGDDANFASTVTTSLATKVTKLSGTPTGAIYFADASDGLAQDSAAILFDAASDKLKLGATSYLGNSVNVGGGYAGTQSFLQVGFDAAYTENTTSVYGILADMKRAQTSGTGQQTSGIRPRAWIQQTGGTANSIATGAECFARNLGSTVLTAMLQGVEGIVQCEENATSAYGGYFSVTNNSGGSGTSTGTMAGVRSIVGSYAGWTVTNVASFDALVSTAGATVTNLYGIKLSGWAGTGVVNSYGIYMDATVDRGSGSKYAIYSLSTSPSLFSGYVEAVGRAYDATTWNGSNRLVTEDSVRDKIESLSGMSLTGVTNPVSGQLKFTPASTAYAIDVDRTSNSGDMLGVRIVSGDGSNLGANKALYILNSAEDRGITHSYESSSSYAINVDSSSYRVATVGGVGGREIKFQPGNTDRLILPVKKDLTDNTTTSLFEVALPTLTGTGGVVKATVFASDGTNVQSRSQIVRYSAVNKAGTYATEIVVVSEAISASTGTLTGTWSILNGTDKITVRVNADSSLTPTTLTVHYTIESFSEQAITLL